MPRSSKLSKAPPVAVEDALERWGRNLRIARLRRKTSLRELAEKIGVSRQVLGDVEAGKLTTSVGAYVAALWALGLLEDLKAVADPDSDEEGKALERARSPHTAPKRWTMDDDF